MRKLYSSLLFLTGLLVATNLGQAQTVANQLENEIRERQSEIKKLEEEITGYKQSLQKTEREKSSLDQEIKVLDLTQKKLAADIKLTDNQIVASTLSIEKLAGQIGDKNIRIANQHTATTESLLQIRRLEQNSLLELLLDEPRLSAAWWEGESLVQLNDGIRQTITALKTVKSELEVDKSAVEAERHKQTAFKNKLSDQQTIAADNKQAKNELLAQTKDKEGNYRKILAERQARKQAFEKEIFDLESRLRLEIDFGHLPRRGNGVLDWPLDNVFITQRFGRTVDSVRLYASGTHNGIDLRASPGTTVKAVASGIVRGVGDTDPVCPRASYGKWIFVEHSNGLSSLYGHLSLIKVSTGQQVNVGELIGYSGNTGYSTGPHLHLTVYATQGVSIRQVPSKVCPGTYTVPIADTRAYLDPEDYL
ncbi:MAG: peptidoglycan DD-metalloendopeptidase family protein [Patescibacteria group bacterium]